MYRHLMPLRNLKFGENRFGVIRNLLKGVDENLPILLIFRCYFYRGADKSLARPGRKQATATEDFHFYISYL
jgi:hypothetical protein